MAIEDCDFPRPLRWVKEQVYSVSVWIDDDAGFCLEQCSCPEDAERTADFARNVSVVKFAKISIVERERLAVHELDDGLPRFRSDAHVFALGSKAQKQAKKAAAEEQLRREFVDEIEVFAEYVAECRANGTSWIEPQPMR